MISSTPATGIAKIARKSNPGEPKFMENTIISRTPKRKGQPLESSRGKTPKPDTDGWQERKNEG